MRVRLLIRLNCGSQSGSRGWTVGRTLETHLLCYDVSEEITAIAATAQPRRCFICWVRPEEVCIGCEWLIVGRTRSKLAAECAL